MYTLDLTKSKQHPVTLYYAADNSSAPIPADYINKGNYNSITKKIELLHDNNIISEIDATEFIKDGMIADINIVDETIVISFNADASKKNIIIPLDDIFNSSKIRSIDTTIGNLKKDIQCIKVRNYFYSELDPDSSSYKILLSPLSTDKETRYEILSISSKKLKPEDDFISIGQNGINGSFGNIISLDTSVDNIILYQTGGDESKISELYYGYDRLDFIKQELERYCEAIYINQFISSLPAKDSSGNNTFSWTGSSGNGRLSIRISSIIETYPELYISTSNNEFKLCELVADNVNLSAKKISNTNIAIDGFKNIESQMFSKYAQCVEYLQNQTFKIVFKLNEPISISFSDAGVIVNNSYFNRLKDETAWIEFENTASGCIELAYLSANDYIYTKDQIDNKFYTKSYISSALESLEQNIEKGEGDYSIIQIGGNNYATNSYAIAEGQNTLASGIAAHSEGVQTLAEGQAAHSEGQETKAKGDYSHSEGFQTESLNITEHAEGIYNKSNKVSISYGDAGNTQHSIGIGTSSNARKNAVEVMQNGLIYIYGINGYDGTNPDSSSNGNSLQAAFLNQGITVDNTLFE